MNCNCMKLIFLGIVIFLSFLMTKCMYSKENILID